MTGVEVVSNGEYIAAGETDVVAEGREAWGRIKIGVKMLREDWVRVGQALIVGRRENPNNKKFGLWCLENGFGEIEASLRSNTIWLARNIPVLSLTQDTINDPTAIRKAYRSLEKEKIGKQKSGITPKKKPALRRIPRNVKPVFLEGLKNFKFVSGWMTASELNKKLTDKQKAQISDAYHFINQLYAEVNNEESQETCSSHVHLIEATP